MKSGKYRNLFLAIGFIFLVVFTINQRQERLTRDSSRSHDFFSKEYSFISLIQAIDAEGKKPVLPFVEINKEGQPEITGMAIFKKDKMIMKLDVQDMKLMNIMIEHDQSSLS